jgi:sugar lactone lactonase YvrE
VDSSGKIYIADTGNHRIRMVSADGIISTVAGNGTCGFSGDGGPVSAAQLCMPAGVAMDSSGNLYIADRGNRRIRKVSTSGIIRTIAGDGTFAWSGGGDGGPAASAQLTGPCGVAVDTSGNLYILDSPDNRIRQVSADGIIHTAAGGGSGVGEGGPATAAQLFQPMGMAVDAAGNLYIADRQLKRIRKVSTSGIISSIAGNGIFGFNGDGKLALDANLSSPSDVAVDAAGNLYIADSGNNRVRKVTEDGIIHTVAGNGSTGFSGDGGPAIEALISSQTALAVDAAGDLYIADRGNNRVRKVTEDGIIHTVAGNGVWGFSGDGGPATAAQLYSPVAVAVDTSGNLYIADNGNYRIRKVSKSGVISTVAGNGTNGFSGDGGPATMAQMSRPEAVAVDVAGNIYIAFVEDSRVRKVTPAGVISTIAGNGTAVFNGDGMPAVSAGLNNPYGVAVNVDGNLLIVDTNNHRIRMVSANGVISTVAGNGNSGFSGDGGPAISAQLYAPHSIAVDTSGNLYIAESGNQRIRKVSADGIIRTIAGNGKNGFSGDGGPATLAQMNCSGVAVDSAGNLYLATSNRIRKIRWLKESIDLTLSAGGIGQASTDGGNLETQTGYAAATVKSGATPYGTAIFSFKAGGVTVSEVAVPASPPTRLARIFIDYRSGVKAVPARSDSGVVDINTGIAIVNYGDAAARVVYTLRDASGGILSIGHGTIAAGNHISCFIDQLKEKAAPDFILPADFQSAIQFGALDIRSDQPLSVLALRGTTNQKKQFLITTTTMAYLAEPPGGNPLYFAQFANGGGYTTSLILMNTTVVSETGVLQVMDNAGHPLVVSHADGTSGSLFQYSIPPNGICRFQTDGFPANWETGWVKVIPDPGTATPVGSGVFGYNPANVLVAESGVPVASTTTHARIYVDRSGNHNTGLAIANIESTAAVITIRAFQNDGVTAVGTSNIPLTLSAHGHDSKFADQLVAGLPAGFTGVLDISSTARFAALTVRSLYNENNDYLTTTFPVADMNRAAASPVVFPQLADGGGYATQFILLSTDGASSTTIHYYGNDGAPLAIGR